MSHTGTSEVDGPGDDETTVRLSVPEMDCPSCAGKVETALDGVEGVSSYDTRPTTGQTVVTYDTATAAETEVTDAVERAGYEVVDDGSGTDDTDAENDPPGVWRSPRTVKTGVGAVFLGAGLALEFLLAGFDVPVASVFGEPLSTADVSFLVAVGAAGPPILRGGYESARQLSLDIDFLMTVAVLGALAASVVFGETLYFEAATLAVLFSVAELLERASIDRARDSLEELMELSPDEATVVRDGERETVPVERLAVGEVVAVTPGEKIPVDGEVADGESAVDQSSITGESVPVEKRPGDEVYAGTISEGYLEVTVTAPAGDDTLSRVVELIEDAQSDTTDREQFVERFAAYYTPAVVVFAASVALGGPILLGRAWPQAVVDGLTLLVLACPCAFVISTPVSVVSGLTAAAKNGVLIKGGSHLEAVGEVDAVAFDKTGTLTRGELTVTDVIPLGDSTETDVLRRASGLETRSEHPIGEAIVERADEADVLTPEIDDFDSVTGKGVEAELDGTRHYAGKPGFFEELGFDLSHVHAATDGGRVVRDGTNGSPTGPPTDTLSPAEPSVDSTTPTDDAPADRVSCDRDDCLDLLADTVPTLQSDGKTVVLVGTADELVGVVAVADEVRPGAAATVERLRTLGVERTVMLTGDNERTAAAIADEVGVDDYRAELLPDEKVAAVDELTGTLDGGAAMVGDGINDAPALAAATVGVAMGAAGTDTALETADVALMGDDLSRLPYLYRLAGRAGGVIRQNVVGSLVVKAGLALAVPFGYVPIWLAVLAGDAGMTVGVTTNAMRLSRVRTD